MGHGPGQRACSRYAGPCRSWRSCFADIAQSISKPGATGIVVDEVVHSGFPDYQHPHPQKGDATLMGPNTIRWTIEELGGD